VAPSDLKFTTNLESIKNEFRLNIDPKLLLKYLEKADISALNSITGNMITNLTKSNDLQKTKTDTMNLLEDLTRVLMDPLTERLSTYKTEAASISKQILELQLKTLNTLDPNDPVVIKVKKSVNEQIKSLPDYLTDSDSATDGQSTAVKRDYAIFKKAFPAGKPPTAAQTAAALELINGNYILGDSPAFIANYAKFVSSGDTKSADKLMEIAKYFGANETYGSSLRQFSNAKLDAKSVEVASEILDFTKNLSAQNISDLRGPILVANRFMLNSVLNNKGGFNSATEGDLTKTFFKSLEEASKEKSSTVTNKELSEFLVSSIYSFSRDLYQDGKVQLISTTSLVQRDISNKQLGPLAKDGIAQMQIDVFEGMLSFYQSQVQGENAKPEPDASKISQWQAQINSHQSAITALQRTLS
jgi:transcriptional regulator with XRE-family HTH domain